MKMEGLTPDIVTYNLLMRAAAQSARITDAWAILEDMEAVGVQPTALTFNHLINVCLLTFHVVHHLMLEFMNRQLERNPHNTSGVH